MTGLARSPIHAMIAAGTFPKPVTPGARAPLWAGQFFALSFGRLGLLVQSGYHAGVAR